MVLADRVKQCPECGKQFFGRYAGRAYAGHMWLSHFKRVGVRGQIVALEQRIKELVADNARLESECRQADKIKKGLGVCPVCYKELGNILYHEKVVGDVKLDGKPVVAFKCKS